MVNMRAILWLVSSFIGWEVTIGYDTDDKMVGGGILRDISKTPYMVSIHVNEQVSVPANVLWHPICTGAIFTAVYVITVCHCVVGEDAAGKVYSLVDAYPLEKWAFLAGAWDLHIPEYLQNNATQRRTPASIHYHPKCYPERTPWLLHSVPVYNVAVARMAVPFDINDYVKPVKIYSFDQIQFKKRLDEVINDKIHSRCIVAGWGSTWDVSIAESLNITLPAPTDNCTAVPFPDVDRYKLKWLRMQARYEVDCLNALVKAIKKTVGPKIFDWPAFEAKFRALLKNQICALSKNASPCRGVADIRTCLGPCNKEEEEGPVQQKPTLLMNVWGRIGASQGDSGAGLVCDDRFIIGLNSFGIGCGTLAPDVFQSVLQVLDWLEKEVCTVETCADVELLHTNCRIQTDKELAIIGHCRTTPVIPKNREDPDDAITSSVTPIEKTKWLIIIMSAVTY